MNYSLFTKNTFMRKISMNPMGKIGSITKVMLLVILTLGMGVNGRGQNPGDFQTKGMTGNWSDFNSWNIRNAANTAWLAAISGQLPTSSTDVFIQSANTIIVDNSAAVCKTIDASAAISTKISFSIASALLSVNGNLIFAGTTHNIFGIWTAGAKFVFAGSAAQTTTSLSSSSTFVNLEVNKLSNSITTDGDLQFSNLLNIVSGTLITGNAQQVRGISNLSHITIQSLGTLTQSGGASIIRTGASGSNPIGNMTVNGILNINTTASSGINVTSLNVEDNGATGGIVNITTTAGGGVITANSGGVTVKNNAFLNISPVCKTTWIASSTTINLETGGNLIISNGSFTLPTTYNFLGTVNYNDGTQTIAPATSYANLILESVSSPANKSFTGGMTIIKDLIIAGKAVLVGSTNTINLGGNWTNYATDGFTENTSIVDLNGAGSQIINTNGGEDFYHIKKSGSGTLTLNSNVTATGASGSGLHISAGIVDAGTNTVSGGATSTLTMTGGTLKLAKLTTLPEFTGTYALSGGTIELNGSGAQVLRSGEAYRNLTFSNATTTTLLSNPASITGTVYITGSALLDIGSSNGFGDIKTNLTMDGGRFKMSGSSFSKPDIDGNFSLTGGVVEFAGSTAGAQPIKGQCKNGSANIIYKNIEVTGTHVGTSNENIILNKTAGNFIIKSGATYAPNSKSIISEHAINTSFVTVENAAFFKTGNNKGFSGTTYTVPANSSIDLNIFKINLNAGSTVDYTSSTVAQNISNQIPYQNLTISGTTVKTAPNELSILGNFSRASGVFNPNIGLVSFDGTTAQTFSSATGSTNFYDIRINNTAAVTVNSDTLNVLNSIALTDNSKLIFGTGNIALKSDINRTAQFTAMPSSASISYPGSGMGRFIIERYLFQKKSWRLLATPVELATYPTITDSWRESGLTTTGFGTQITGPVATYTGMDENTQRGSMKWYDAAIQNYKEISNTASAIARAEGYFVFVRGDRTQNLGGAGSSTTLRIKGKINTGTQPNYNVLSDKFASFGNPYASAIDFRNVSKSTNMIDAFTVWNPNSPFAFYGVGGFENYIYNTGTGHYQTTPGNIIRDTIQSGEAVFIQSGSKAGGGYITIEENDKVGGSRLVSRTKNESGTSENTATLEINLRTDNLNNTSLLADGVRIDFDNNHSNGIENTDVRKVFNAVDNLSILKNNYKLVVERHAPLQITDTIFLQLTNTRVASYHFEIDPSVLGNLALNAFLTDKFLLTDTPVSLIALTTVGFSITSDAGSRVADRFMIVFREAVAAPLPFGFTAISGEQNADKTNHLKWSVANEININNYHIERSAFASGFTAIATTAVTGNNGNTGSYNFVDVATLAGVNYYRVKSISGNGKQQYSSVVKVVDNDVKPQFNIRPNPVINKILNIDFDNIQGSYTLKLVAKQGATVFSKQVTVSAASNSKKILIGSVAAGVYDVLLVDVNGKQFVQTVFIQ